MTEITDEVLDLLEKHPWDDTIPRLVYYVLKKMKRLYWQGIFGGPAPGGVEAQDVVQKSIEKVFTGRRSWNPDTHPDLFDYLESVIDSEISHLAEEWENRIFRREEWLPGTAEEKEKDDDPFDRLQSSNPGPEKILLEKEKEKLSEQLFWEFYESLAEHPKLQKILECISEGAIKRSEIAKATEVSTKEFDNLKKQLQRRLRSFIDSRQGEK